MITIQNLRASWLASLLLLPSVAGWGSNVSFDTIDQHARSAPARVTHDVTELAAYLVKPAKNDLEKVRSFYVWIAENIAYDVRAFTHYNPNRYQKVAPNEVLKRRKAVCQGYAELFQALCQLHGIPCYLIPGYSKGLATSNQDFTQADHAWNAVKIDNQWQLLDVTWGSGGLNRQLTFVKQFNESYFLAPPEDFVRDHLPLDPIWQLLECPISMSSFVQGGEAIQKEHRARSTNCETWQATLLDYEQLSPLEQDLSSAQRAYDFNPANALVLMHAYLNQAHHLMSSIPQSLRSRVAIQEALATQEEALVYLKKAETVLGYTKKGEALREKEILKANLTTSENNLKGLRKALE